MFNPDTDFPVDSGRYIGVDDQVMVNAASNAATQAITVRGRLCRKDGVLVPFTFTFTTGAAAAVLTKTFQLAEGFLESLQVSSPACATAGQWMYASIGLTRGTGAAAVPFETLFADYVGSVLSIGWPRAILRRPNDGPGVVRSIAVASPAAGAEWAVTVPAGVQWQPLYGVATFVTSPQVANRQMGITLTDGTNTLWSQQETLSFPASSTAIISYQASMPHTNAGIQRYDGFWPQNTLLPSAYTLGSVTYSVQTGDQYSAIQISVIEWAMMQ